jgi:hypothetical protein
MTLQSTFWKQPEVDIDQIHFFRLKSDWEIRRLILVPVVAVAVYTPQRKLAEAQGYNPNSHILKSVVRSRTQVGPLNITYSPIMPWQSSTPSCLSLGGGICRVYGPTSFVKRVATSRTHSH